MIFIVDSIHVASNTPKRLEPLAEEIRKAVHYAFPDKEALEKFIRTVQKNLQKKVTGSRIPLSVNHTTFEEMGSLQVRRSDTDSSDFIRMHYFKLKGHVHVSHDGTTLYPEAFIEEGGENV